MTQKITSRFPKVFQNTTRFNAQHERSRSVNRLVLFLKDEISKLIFLRYFGKLLHMRFILTFLLLCCFGMTSAWGQKVLQIEKYGKARTEKIFIGEEITYKLKGEKEWRQGYIEDFLVDEKMIVLGNRYVKIDEIAAFRYYRSWTKAAKMTFFWFGAGWSLFAAVGTLTDGDPSTHYRWSDAFVTGTSWFLAFVIPKIFKYKVVKFGVRKRLRLLDLRFKEGVGGAVIRP